MLPINPFNPAAFRASHSFSKYLSPCWRFNLRNSKSHSFIGRPGLQRSYSWAHSSTSSRFHYPQMKVLTLRNPLLQWSLTFTGLAGLGLGLSSLMRPVVECQSNPSPPPTVYPTAQEPSASYPPPPKSSVDMYELTFGTICGICAGVFIKKGAKVLAFVLGGVFVMLQYLGSASVIRVDWSRIATRFENLFYTTDAYGAHRHPNLYSLWNWLINFLTADFQPRASFIAGLALGLRIG